MATPSMALLDYLRKVGADLEPDFLREAVRVISELLMEAEVSQQTGAERYEHSAERKTYRNGYRERTWDTRLRGAKQQACMARLEQEHDNLRAALRWAEEGGELELGLRLGGALRYYWQVGNRSEGRAWLEALLARADAPAQRQACHAAGAGEGIELRSLISPHPDRRCQCDAPGRAGPHTLAGSDQQI